MQLRGKTALVFGAGSNGEGIGNGKAAAIAHARAGANVFVVDLSRDAANQTRDMIRDEGFLCESGAANVAESAPVAVAVADCIAAFDTIDILHNNVGIYSPGGAASQTEEEWDAMMAANLRGLYQTCRHALPEMTTRGGAIVNVGSVSAMRTVSLPVIAYATSKAGVTAFTRTVATEFGPKGIHANVVVPGIIDTPMFVASEGAYAAQFGAGKATTLRASPEATVPLRRFGSPWDVAAASVFLASDEAGYITGTELIVDGGLTCMAPQPS